jgi:hypothetical protein
LAGPPPLGENLSFRLQYSRRVCHADFFRR